MRGVVGALATIGLLDSLGWIREDWLRVVHAIATRWNTWIGWIADQINVYLPFRAEITKFEANYLVAFSTFGLPALIGHGVRLWKQGDKGQACKMLIVVPLVPVSTLFMNVTNESPFGVQELGVIFTVGILAFCFIAMWHESRTYLKALVAALTCLLTFELIYLAPSLQTMLKPIVDWIDPQT